MFKNPAENCRNGGKFDNFDTHTHDRTHCHAVPDLGQIRSCAS